MNPVLLIVLWTLAAPTILIALALIYFSVWAG